MPGKVIWDPAVSLDSVVDGVTVDLNPSGVLEVKAGGISNLQVGLATSHASNHDTARTTTSLTAVMAGYGAATTPVVFTPLKTGILEVHVTYQVSNNTNNDGVQAQISYGTGTAPAEGAAAAGTVLGSLFKAISASVNAYEIGAATDLVTGAELGVQLWFDLQWAAITGGTGSLGPATWVIKELLA